MKKARLVPTVLLIGLLTIGVAAPSPQVGLTLEAPSVAAAGSSFLEGEAGITAYTKVYAVDLVQAAQVFKNVEKRTDEYVVGSVSLSGYPESDDVHVYVDVSGWIAAYYLANEPASKIIDWVDYKGSITSTKPEDALVKVTNALAVEMPFTKYYDFRFPNATKIMIVADETRWCKGVMVCTQSTETFNIRIPDDYTVYSRTWSHAIYGINAKGNIKVDGTTLHSGSIGGGQASWRIWEGTLTPTQLSPDVYHTVSVHVERKGLTRFKGWCSVGIVLIYEGQGG